MTFMVVVMGVVEVEAVVATVVDGTVVNSVVTFGISVVDCVLVTVSSFVVDAVVVDEPPSNDNKAGGSCLKG